MTRQVGETIQFRVMPWVNPTGPIRVGVITRVCQDDLRGMYYHVDTVVGGEPVRDGIVLESEIIRPHEEE